MGDASEITLGDGGQVLVPSGQSVILQDIIWNSAGPDGPVARFRFVAPAISRVKGTVDGDQVAKDLLHLCETVVLEKLAQKGPLPPNVLVSMADRAVNFGETIPEATQYFESYRIEGNLCISELF